MKVINTHNAIETVEVGKSLGKLLRAGDIVCLSGNLGTGKTAFTNGIAEALGIRGPVTSPTFTIVNEHRGSGLMLYHFDVYRIADPEEMFEIGFEEYLDAGGIVVIEWAELIMDIIPPEHIRVSITKNLKAGPDERAITLDFRGGKYLERESLI